MSSSENDTSDMRTVEVPTEPSEGDVITSLPEAMTGRASPAKAAVGDKPVFAYIASLPQPQRDIAEAVDTLAAKTLPNLQRKATRGVELGALDELDERQVAAWMRQITSVPGIGGKRR